MSKRLSLLLAVLAIFGLIAAACGGDDDDATPVATDEGSSDSDAGADEGSDDEGAMDDDEGAMDDDEGAMDDDEGAMDDDESAAALPGEGITVTAARANWTTGYFQAAIYAELLTELGYDVTDPADNEFPPSNGYTAMAEGVIDFWANSWNPGHFSWYENELTDGSTVGDHVTPLGNELIAAGLEGVMVTKSWADEMGIESWQQINDTPELYEALDIDDNGIGNIFGCPEDWTCDDIINAILEFNGWTNLEQTKAGYDAMVAESLNRVNDGVPTLQYTWSPSGYLTQLVPGDNVLWLGMSAENVLDGSVGSDAWDFNDAPPAALGDSCTLDPCYTGWVAADIQVTANNEFLAANPAAEALFLAVELSVIDVALQNVDYNNGENSEDDVKRHAAEWVAANRDLVDEWIAAALAAA